MKELLIILTLLPSLLFAQDDLLKRIENLESLNNELLTRQKLLDKELYLAEKRKLDISITLGSTLSTKWNALQNNISVSKGLSKVTEINSIGKDNALGFDFNKVIEDLIQTNLTIEIDNLPDLPEIKNELKSRWKENVGKIINNPIIQGLVKSNPLTSIASSLISSAIGLTDNKVKTSADMVLKANDPLPKKYSDFVTSWKDKIKIEATSINSVGSTKNLISQTAIENFTNSIKPYTELFDQMSNSNTRFSLKLEEISIYNTSYSEIISTYDKQLMTQLKIAKISDAPARINELLKVDETIRLPKYIEVIENKDIQGPLKLAHQYNDLKDKVNELTVNYYQIHIEYFEEYIKHLDTALTNTTSGKTKFNQAKILLAKEFIGEQIKQCRKAKEDLLKAE